MSQKGTLETLDLLGRSGSNDVYTLNLTQYIN
jgi:hypothetical protein